MDFARPQKRAYPPARSAGPTRAGALALAAVLLAWLPAAAFERRCARAQGLAGDEKAIPALSEKIENGLPIRIVALGSSSTEGTPDLPKEAVFPAVLARELARQVLAPVELVNKGRGGETIPRMVARLERDVISLKPDLLVWQLGANDVLQMDGVQNSVELMRATLGRLHALRIPVVLVDLQMAPVFERDRDTPVMQEAIREAGKREGVMHFHRQAIMKRLVDLREATEQDLVQQDGLHMTTLGHFCTGALLARQIARAGMLKRSEGTAAPPLASPLPLTSAHASGRD
ncbi:MAG: SGNH/GDSL hydrolase family protein [Hyphomicrobiales bacterium]|uniref:SGNH/GDSL hydrolase family protein n=1 Tax=Rhabdaerophilum calidifontis TaxID=2604328 RepID=UPI00123B4802|nr:SGNH/GDSL hydrolase family protein [Rhabdaerophilum calidifontis]MCA1951759.1 SGNH/GDSL hydrolase family protein [Hyphomicrobiales bacterium]MCA1998664.1 SGNH/GDSL hydrolase family protein [Hyphomicrobiales bacterium]